MSIQQDVESGMEHTPLAAQAALASFEEDVQAQKLPKEVRSGVEEIMSCINNLPEDGIYDVLAVTHLVRTILLDIYVDGYRTGLDEGLEQGRAETNGSPKSEDAAT